MIILANFSTSVSNTSTMWNTRLLLYIAYFQSNCRSPLGFRGNKLYLSINAVCCVDSVKIKYWSSESPSSEWNVNLFYVNLYHT